MGSGRDTLRLGGAIPVAALQAVQVRSFCLKVYIDNILIYYTP